VILASPIEPALLARAQRELRADPVLWRDYRSRRRAWDQSWIVPLFIYMAVAGAVAFFARTAGVPVSTLAAAVALYAAGSGLIRGGLFISVLSATYAHAFYPIPDKEFFRAAREGALRSALLGAVPFLPLLLGKGALLAPLLFLTMISIAAIIARHPSGWFTFLGVGLVVSAVLTLVNVVQIPVSMVAAHAVAAAVTALLLPLGWIAHHFHSVSFRMERAEHANPKPLEELRGDSLRGGGVIDRFVQGWLSPDERAAAGLLLPGGVHWTASWNFAACLSLLAVPSVLTIQFKPWVPIALCALVTLAAAPIFGGFWTGSRSIPGTPVTYPVFARVLWKAAIVRLVLFLPLALAWGATLAGLHHVPVATGLALAARAWFVLVSLQPAWTVVQHYRAVESGRRTFVWSRLPVIVARGLTILVVIAVLGLGSFLVIAWPSTSLGVAVLATLPVLAVAAALGYRG
jgi:hypothetical protein